MLRATGSAHHEETIRRSRFIGDSVPVESRDRAETIVSNRRQQHPNASHVVYAYAIGGDKDQQFGMSDDGEPKGTAGRPIMEILKGSGITDCVVTVVRYFGGTKLGTGGLVHAYGGVARECIQKTPSEPRVLTVRRLIECPYELHQPVSSVLERHGCSIESQEFGTAVTLYVDIAKSAEPMVATELRDVSRGTITLADTETND